MKNYNYLFTVLLSSFLFISCSEGTINDLEETTNGELTSFSVDKNSLFIEEKANLFIDKIEGYPTVEISSSNTNITITKVDEKNYTISSSEAGSALITITALDEKGNQLKGLRRLYFYEHGTTDYQTIEGISIDIDKTTKVLSLHGEPEGKTSFTSGQFEFEYWFYFSKGFRFKVLKSSNTVAGITLFNSTWSMQIDAVINTGSIYPHPIDGMSSLENENGLMMDEVVKKYGTPNGNGLSSDSTSNLKWYIYNILNKNDANIRYAYFHFRSDDMDEYTDKNVLYVHID